MLTSSTTKSVGHMDVELVGILHMNHLGEDLSGNKYRIFTFYLSAIFLGIIKCQYEVVLH